MIPGLSVQASFQILVYLKNLIKKTRLLSTVVLLSWQQVPGPHRNLLTVLTGTIAKVLTEI